MNRPVLIDQPNISLAWADAILSLREIPGHRLNPLMLTFTGCESGEVEEADSVRSCLDSVLQRTGNQKTHTVANTIFPQVLWRRAKDRKELYASYLESLPDYIEMEPHKNNRGLYFGRLIAFNFDHRSGKHRLEDEQDDISTNGNQLEFIIQHCKPGTRVSMLQASIFDPARDHTSAAQLGFPCLQHVTFTPDFPKSTLALNAFFATQQLFIKGYGNYLGLARLGLFVASQVGLELERVTCFVGVAKMENKPTKDDMREIIDVCEHALGQSPKRGGR